jgi:hypothetical protein
MQSVICEHTSHHLTNLAWVHGMKCPHCNKEIPDQQIQQEAARIMIKKRPKRRLSPEAARAMGRKGLEKRWAKPRKKHWIWDAGSERLEDDRLDEWASLGIMPISNHLGALQRDQPAFHHPVQLGKKCRDPFRRIDYFYHNREIAGKTKNIRWMQVTRFAKPKRPTQNCGSSEAFFAGLENDGFIQREMTMTIILTKEDAQQDGFFRKIRRANRRPAVTEFKLCG